MAQGTEQVAAETREASDRAAGTAKQNVSRLRETAERTSEQARAAFERSAEQAQDFAAQASEAVQSTVERVRENAERAGEQARAAAERAAAQAREISETLADSVARTTDVALDLTQKAADQSREVIWTGVRTAAGVQGRVADASYGRSYQLFGSAARAIEVYRQASDDAATNVQALVTSYLHLGRGLQELQQAYFDLLSRSMERSSRRREELMRTRSFEEFARVQRDIYVESVGHTLEATSRLLELASQAAQGALRPLQEKAAASTLA